VRTVEFGAFTPAQHVPDECHERSADEERNDFTSDDEPPRGAVGGDSCVERVLDDVRRFVQEPLPGRNRDPSQSVQGAAVSGRARSADLTIDFGCQPRCSFAGRTAGGA
jgi:hypothetical protein